MWFVEEDMLRPRDLNDVTFSFDGVSVESVKANNFAGHNMKHHNKKQASQVIRNAGECYRAYLSGAIPLIEFK